MKDDADYKNLVSLIKQRASILKKMKKAKGQKLEDLKEDLKITQKYIRMLDEKQK